MKNLSNLNWLWVIWAAIVLGFWAHHMLLNKIIPSVGV